MTMRWLVMGVLVLVACGSEGDTKKTKKAKPPTLAQRADRVCVAQCDREQRCGDDGATGCLDSCRQERARRLHVYRSRFVFAYADCLDRLACDKDVGRCQAVAVAEVMADPVDETEDPEAGAGGKADAKDKADAKGKGPKPKKKKKKDPEAERKRLEEVAAAEAARELYQRCHDRRIGCGESWEDRCNSAAALNDGGRERVRACLGLPCSQIRRCLQDAVSW